MECTAQPEHHWSVSGRQYHYGPDMATGPSCLSAVHPGHLRDIHAATLAMPLRMPMTLSLDDPSQDRKVRRSLFSFWPTLFQYEADETSPHGDFYVGYRRINDIGRELWLSMDDLTRHVMFLPPPVAVKQKPPLPGCSTRSAGEEALPLLTERHRTIPRGQSGISPDVLAGRMISRSSTS